MTDRIFIGHILENIVRIEEFTKDITYNELKSDALRQYAIVRALEIIGEATKNISSFFKERHAHISWKKMSGTRDIIVHRYFGVDLEVVWKILHEDVPLLKEQLLSIQKELT